MSNNKNNDRITPANIIAIIAVAALGVLTFFGALFLQEDGTMGLPAIIAGAFTVGLGILLFICIMAKTTEKEFNKWRVFEYISLAAYLIVAVTCYKPFLQFFHVLQHKTTLQTMAMNEIDAINNLCAQYNEEAEQAMKNAANYMKELRTPGQNYSEDSELRKYMEDKKISNIDNWLDEDEGNMSRVRFNQENLDSLESKIQTWNFMDFSSIAYEMKDKAGEIWTQLDDHIKSNEREFGLVPVIRIDSTSEATKFYLAGMAKFDIGECPTTSAFTTEFRKPWSGFNIGIIFYALLHLLALMNYFLVRRSPIIQIRKDTREDDGGLLLDTDAR